MAEGFTSLDLQSDPCNYLQTGYCHRGPERPVPHDSTNTSQILCKYYMKSTCKFEDHCRYSHSAPSQPPTTRKPMPNSRLNANAPEFTASQTWEPSAQASLRAQRQINSRPTPSIAPPPNVSSVSTSLSNMTILPKSSSSKASPSFKMGGSPSSSSNNQIKTKSASGHSPKNSKTFEKLKAGDGGEKTSKCNITSAEAWVNAPEFVPKDKTSYDRHRGVTWANVVGSSASGSTSSAPSTGTSRSISELCPYYLLNQQCTNYNQCPYIHGMLCDVCQLACLHPGDEQQRMEHVAECTKLMEEDMEDSFALARSLKVTCGICMDNIMDRKLPSQRRFGILTNCSHSYCLDCIRKWRSEKNFENNIVKSCPECRVHSDYIIPSRYWVDDKSQDEKDKLVSSYRDNLAKKECKYFDKGNGTCPFGNKCFYRHALADGTVQDVGPPKRKTRVGADGELQQHLENFLIWEFMEERERRMDILRESIHSIFLEYELTALAETLFNDDSSGSDVGDGGRNE